MIMSRFSKVQTQLCSERIFSVNPLTPRTLCRWGTLRSLTNSIRLAFNVGRVMQECEKIYTANIRSFFLKNYKSYDKTLLKHFNAYLSNLLKMVKVTSSLDQIQSNYSDKLTQLDIKQTKMISELAAKHK